jgi:hypothetical protein
MTARRLRQKVVSRRAIAVAVVLGCATAIAVAELGSGAGKARSAATPSFSVEAKGRAIRLTERQARRLNGAPTSGSVSLLGIRGGRAFYRVGDARSNCYGVGEASSIGTLGAFACWDGPHPLMDLSVVDLSRGSTSEMRFFRVEGIAADQVSSVGVLTPDGRIAARVPVVGNLYSLPTPPDTFSRGLVALDGRGRPLTTLPGP